jgi:hypothetical protein
MSVISHESVSDVAVAIAKAYRESGKKPDRHFDFGNPYNPDNEGFRSRVDPLATWSDDTGVVPVQNHK